MLNLIVERATAGVSVLIEKIYDPLYTLWESKASARFQSTVLVVVFVLAMMIAALNSFGVNTPAVFHDIQFFKSVEISFTLLLFFEMISLVFVIPFSIAKSIGKQIQILSLVLVRSSFREFSHFDFKVPFENQLDSFFKMVSDGLGALLVFLLLGVFYGINHHAPEIEESARVNFVRFKKLIALLILATLLATEMMALYQSILSGEWAPSIDSFYLVIIFADVLLMLVAFRYTLHYPELFQYSAFTLVTVFIRMSLIAPVYINTLLGLFSVLYAVAIAYFNRLFTQGRLKYIDKEKTIKEPVNTL